MAANQSYNEISYRAPYRGLNVGAPETMIPASDSPYLNNVIIRNAEIRTRPRLSPYLPHPRDTGKIRGTCSFIDQNNVVHTLAITPENLWQLSGNWRNANQDEAWAKVGRYLTIVPTDTPIRPQIYLNKAYWTAGSQGLFYWDGITNTISVASADYGAYYLGELSNRLILLNVVEAGGNFPSRIRWSANGIPTQWLPASNPSAGLNDLLDVPNGITGFLTIGNVGFIFRTNGISEMVPTGVGTNPWDFNHLWASEKGIGNVQPQSIDSYGSIGIFLSSEEFYQMSAASFKEIGGGAFDQVNTELTYATENVIGNIIPVFSKQYRYLLYILSIPVENDCIYYAYSIQEQNWTRWTSSKGAPTSMIKFLSII